MKYSILTIIPSLFGGGAEKITADLSFALSKKYKHNLLLYNSKKEKYKYEATLTELKIPKKKSFIGRIIRQFFILKKIKKFKNTHLPNVTISHMLIANMLNILSKKNDKVICVLHGEWSVKNGKLKFIDNYIKKQYAKADMIVSVSHYIKNMFEDYYSFKLPHKVIYIGVDAKTIKQKANEKINIQLPKKYLIYVAGFRPVKNHIILIKQLEKHLKTTDIHLVLVGDGELKGEIENTIKELNLSNKILLLGNLTNPYPLIKNAKLSLLVSSSESFSLVIVESMVLGVPVISTDCGGPREIIDIEWRNNKSTPYITEFGVLIKKPKYWSNNSLTTQIELLLKNKDLYTSISVKSKQRAKFFNIENTNKNLDLIIKNII